MSKTDKDAPTRVHEARGDCRRDTCGAGYPCRHISMHWQLKAIKNDLNSRERTRIRTAIQRGEDDILTDQHRHAGLWDLV
jgi:hypothetical protein